MHAILGAQTLGSGDAVKRVDLMATALRFGATVDAVGNRDPGYSPPFTGALDNLHQTPHGLRNELNGVAEGLSSYEVRAKLD